MGIYSLLVLLVLSLVQCSSVQKQQAAYKTAIENSDYGTVLQYLEAPHNMSPNMEFGNSFITPLIIAARNRDLDIVNLLLTYGADKNKTNASGGKPVLATVLGENPTSFELVEALLPEHINYDAMDQDRCSVSGFAKRFGHHEVLEEIRVMYPNGAGRKI